VRFSASDRPDEYLVHVLSDGETVQFTRPDGTVLHCDRDALGAVVGEGCDLAPGVGYGRGEGALEAIDARQERRRHLWGHLVPLALFGTAAVIIPSPFL
jgi:hypothetical protein